MSKFDLDIENKLVGNYFKTIRIQRGYSEEYMSYRLNVSQSTISNVENGKIKIDVVRIMEFCNVLDIGLTELVYAMIEAVGGEVPKSKYNEGDPMLNRLDQIATHLDQQNKLMAILVKAIIGHTGQSELLQLLLALETPKKPEVKEKVMKKKAK